MSLKVTALEQEIERLTDGAELENVSPLKTRISNQSFLFLAQEGFYFSELTCFKRLFEFSKC